MSKAVSVKSILEKALKEKEPVSFVYTALNGERTARSATPTEFVTGVSGEAVIAADDSGTRRFILDRIDVK